MFSGCRVLRLRCGGRGGAGLGIKSIALKGLGFKGLGFGILVELQGFPVSVSTIVQHFGLAITR